jgi:LPXTG-site transpeptidase (sortase) family protein
MRIQKYANITGPRTDYTASLLYPRQHIEKSPAVGTAKSTQSKKRKNSKKRTIGRTLTTTLGVFLVLGGLASLVLIYKGNKAVIQQVAELEGKVALQPPPDSPTSSEGLSALGEGTLPSTSNKPTVSNVLDYKVQGNRPKRIEINDIGVFAKVVKLGLNNKGQIDVPVSIYDAGWYEGSSLTQAKPGATVIVGHVGSGRLGGVFENIGKLKPGAKISVVNADDTITSYTVTGKEDIPTQQVDMGRYLSHPEEEKAVLHLITCSGNFVRNDFSYDHRTVVSAVQD